MLVSIFNKLNSAVVAMAVAKDEAVAKCSTLHVQVAAEIADAKKQVADAKEAMLTELMAKQPACFSTLTAQSTDKEIKDMVFNARKAQYIAERANKAVVAKATPAVVESTADMLKRIAAAKPYTHVQP